MYRHCQSPLLSTHVPAAGMRWRTFRLSFYIINTNYSASQSTGTKKFAGLALSRRANQGFHVIEIALQSFTPRRGQTIFRLRQPSFKRFRAHDVVRFFEFARVDAEGAGGCV